MSYLRGYGDGEMTTDEAISVIESASTQPKVATSSSTRMILAVGALFGVIYLLNATAKQRGIR